VYVGALCGLVKAFTTKDTKYHEGMRACCILARGCVKRPEIAAMANRPCLQPPVVGNKKGERQCLV